MSKSFWTDLGLDGAETPVRLLKQAANELSTVTKGALAAEVKSQEGEKALKSEKALIHDFSIRVPSANNYRVTILEVTQPLKIFPAKVLDRVSGVTYICDSYAKFEETLYSILESEPIKNIVRSLHAQAKP